ncbi:MAG: NAD-dependent epimerase/dehydratase family protein [Oscillospiraceae bacterium]
MFHLAGVNRASHPEAFWEGNLAFTRALLAQLADHPCPILFTSILAGDPTLYGQSKLAAEEALLQYGAATGAEVFLYRLPHVFGRGSRPDYNSAVATFCHRMARGLPITIQNPGQRLHLAYVDDVVEEFLACFSGSPCQKDGFCHIPKVSSVTLEDILALLSTFNRRRAEGALPPLHAPFAKQLLRHLPELSPPRGPAPVSDHAPGSPRQLHRAVPHRQPRAALRQPHPARHCPGQPLAQNQSGNLLGGPGRGVIRLKSPTGEVCSFPVSRAEMTAIDIPPGYAHTIENRGSTDLVTLLWASECFDPSHPDTYPQEV